MTEQTQAETEARFRIERLREQAERVRATAMDEQDQADRSRQFARDLDAEATSWELLLEAAARGAAATVREPDGEAPTPSEPHHVHSCCGAIA